MPNTQFDAKSINPEAFRYLVGRVPNLRQNEIRKSRAVAGSPEIKALFASQDGTAYARMAMKGLLDGEPLNYDGNTDITATSTKTYEQGVVVVGRAKAWTEKDFSYDITGGQDFMANVAAQVAEYKQTVDEDTLLAVLEGIFAMTDKRSAEFVRQHTYDATAEKHTGTPNGCMTSGTLNSACNKACGANKKKFSLVFVHSDVATNLENMNLVNYLKYTDKQGISRDLGMATWNGKLLVVDDDLPVQAGFYAAAEGDEGAVKVVADSATDGQINLADVKQGGFYPDGVAAEQYVVAGNLYTSYVLGDGAISYEDVGVKVGYEMARDPKTNGGVDTLYMRQRKAVAPYGISYEKKQQASLSPTDEELRKGENWALVHSGESGEEARSCINHRAIPIARILSRG